MSTKHKDSIFGIIFTHLFMTKGGESNSRALKSLFLAINAKGGESIKPKAKGPHHHRIFNYFKKNLISIFQIGIFKDRFSKLASKLRIYFQLVSISKTLLKN